MKSFILQTLQARSVCVSLPEVFGCRCTSFSVLIEIRTVFLNWISWLSSLTVLWLESMPFLYIKWEIGSGSTLKCVAATNKNLLQKTRLELVLWRDHSETQSMNTRSSLSAGSPYIAVSLPPAWLLVWVWARCSSDSYKSFTISGTCFQMPLLTWCWVQHPRSDTEVKSNVCLRYVVWIVWDRWREYVYSSAQNSS